MSRVSLHIGLASVNCCTGNNFCRIHATMIGTLNEKALHIQLKQYVAQAGDCFEVPLEQYVIDIVRGEQLIEIQTAGLGKMKRKLDALTPDHAVRVVYPIAAAKWINKQGKRRKSPKRCTIYHLFDELVSLPKMVAYPDLTLDVLLVHLDEFKLYDAKRKHRRRRGWIVAERRLIEVVGSYRFESAADLATLLPSQLDHCFDSADLAHAISQPRTLAQKMLYCLYHLGVVERVGKKGNTHLYCAVETSDAPHRMSKNTPSKPLAVPTIVPADQNGE